MVLWPGVAGCVLGVTASVKFGVVAGGETVSMTVRLWLRLPLVPVTVMS
jgi:hypothetical protein